MNDSDMHGKKQVKRKNKYRLLYFILLTYILGAILD